MLLIRLLRSLFPLLRDIFIGRQSLKEALKDSKLKLLLLFAVLFSISLNFYLIPTVFALSLKLSEMNKVVKQIDKPQLSSEAPNLDPYDGQEYYLDQFQKLKK